MRTSIARAAFLASAVALLLVVAAIAAGCGGGAQKGTVTVVIKDLRFNPETVRIAPGDTVRWVNEDTTAHTSTSADFSADATSNPPAAWNSPVLDPGQSFERKFPDPGKFPYGCSVHPYIKGTVVVEKR